MVMKKNLQTYVHYLTQLYSSCHVKMHGNRTFTFSASSGHSNDPRQSLAKYLYRATHTGGGGGGRRTWEDMLGSRDYFINRSNHRDAQVRGIGTSSFFVANLAARSISSALP